MKKRQEDEESVIVDIEATTQVASSESIIARKQYTYNEKLDKVRRYMAAPWGQRDKLVKASGVKYGTTASWMANYEDIKKAVQRGFGTLTKLMPLVKYKELFEQAYKYYCTAREMFSAVPMYHIRLYCMQNSEEFSKLKVKDQYFRIGEFEMHYGLSARRRTGLTQLLPSNFQERHEAHFRVVENSLKDECFPEFIILLDETGVLWNPAPTTTLAPKGSKCVPIRIKYEKKQSTCLLWVSECIKRNEKGYEIFNAKYENPYIIFEGKKECQRSNSVESKVRKAVEQKPTYAEVNQTGFKIR